MSLHSLISRLARLTRFGLVALLLLQAPESQSDTLDNLLESWARTGQASPEAVDGILGQVDITSKQLEQAFLDRIKAAGKLQAGGEAAFTQQVLDTLDRARFERVQKAVDSVLAEFGDELEAVVRTGSSGQRHLQLYAGRESAGGYRLFFSDDDISFVGKKAIVAGARLNELLDAQGLAKLKVKGFDLFKLRQIRNLDLIALDMLDPEKFLGEAGMGSIKQEMLDKGAVIAQNSGAGMRPAASPLKSFVESKKSRMLAELLDEKAAAEAVKKFGSLTMVASCERQIVDAHGGWSKLADPEKAKYVLRQRLALAESGALTKIAGMDASAIAAELAKLRELKAAGILTAEQIDWLQAMRFQNAELAFAEIPLKMDPIIAAAEAKGGSIAGNAEIRKAIDELTTAWALVDRQIMDIPEEKILAAFRRTAGDNDMVYKMLYTSYQQSRDLTQALQQWIASGGTRESFLEMLVKLGEGDVARAARKAAVQARMAKKAKTPEASVLKAFEEMLGTELGDTFIVKMAKNPTARKVLATTMIASGGAYLTKRMYDSWMQGTAHEDLSNAAFALIDFVPGGMSFKRAATEGLDSQTAFLFAKEALYFTPAWPLVLAGDLAYVAVEIGSVMQTSNYHDSLVDLLVYNGEYDAKTGKFLRLGRLPDGPVVETEDLKRFLFETKAVKVRMAVAGVGFWKNNLSQETHEVYDKFYLANDKVMQQLRQAADQQIGEINRHAAERLFENTGSPFLSLSYLAWISAYQNICEKSPENWCRVFNLLKTKMVDRQELVAAKVMVPQLVQLAEAKRATLDASDKIPDKIKALQEAFEALRDREPLGVILVDAVSQGADAEADKLGRATGEAQDLARGKYWQAALASYSRIHALSQDMRASVAAKTGYAQARPLRFKWSGEHATDLRLAEQSKAGFASDIARITRDIAGIKGKPPSPEDAVDKQAFALLGEVVFPWRVLLDEADQAQAPDASPFHAAYKDALEKVKALYGDSAGFQAQVDQGARIQPAQNTLPLGKGVDFELVFSDPTLKKAHGNGQIGLKWSNDGQCGIKPNDKAVKVSLTCAGVQPVTLVVTLERPGVKTAKATLKVTMPVTVPDNFLTLALTTTRAKPGELIGASADIPQAYYGAAHRFHYTWTCNNCRIEDTDRSSVAVTAPKSGEATVGVALTIEAKDGRPAPLATKQASFVVGAAGANLTVGIDAPKQAKAGERVTLRATVKAASGALPPLKYAWSQAGKSLGDQVTASFAGEQAGTYDIALRVQAQVGGAWQAAGETTHSLVVSGADPGKDGKPVPTDPKGRAEAKYQWLKDSLVYLEVLKEYDRKTYASFKNGVTSAMVREFTAANPPRYDAGAKLPEGSRCGQSVGDARKLMNQYGAECSSLLAKGCTVINTNLITRTINGVEVKVAEPVTDCDTACGMAQACGQAFSTYSGSAGYASSVSDHLNQNFVRCLSESGAANGRNQKELARKIEALPESLPFKRWQEYKAYNDWTGYLAAVDKVKQEFNLPDPIPVPPVLTWKYTSPCGAGAGVTPPKDEAKGELKVTLSGPGSGANLKPGDSASLDAKVNNGKPPYRYAWSGASGTGAKATAKPAWAGDWTVLVQVTDADGKTGEAKTSFTVKPLTLKLTGAQGKVFYGRTYTLNAEGLEPVEAPKPPPGPDPCAGHVRTNNPFDECNTISVDDLKSVSVSGNAVIPTAPIAPDTSVASTSPKPSATPKGSGKYRYLWQPHPELEFDPYMSDKPSTKVTYNRLGQVKLWCAVHTFVEGAWHTIGECDQVSVEVIPPAFAFTFRPPDGQARIGQEVRAVLGTKPEVAAKYLDYRWLEPGTSNRMEYTPNASDIGFKVKDTKPMVLKVLARVPKDGDTLADLTATYTGVAYDVQIGAPRINGPQLQQWVCDTQLGRAQQCGMKDIPAGQFVTFQDIYLKALVTPAADSPRYLWTVSPSGSCGRPGFGSELHLNCSNTGTYAVNLEVSDADGNVLGKAESSVSVSVQMEQTKPGKKPDSGADAKVREAKLAVEAGRLDQGIDLVAQAVNLDPKHAEAGSLRNRWQNERQQVTQSLQDANRAMEQGDMDKAGAAIANAKRLHPRYQPVLDAERALEAKRKAKADKDARIAQLAEAVRQQIRAGQYELALNSLKDLRGQDTAKADALAKELASAAKQAAKAAEQTRDFKNSGRLFGIAAQADPQDIDAARGVNNAPVYAKRMQEVRAWQSEVRTALDRGDYDTAGKRLFDIRAWEATLPGPADAATSELQNRHDKELAAYRKTMDDLRLRAEKAMLNRKCDEAQSLVGQVAARRPLDQERKWLDMMNTELAARGRRGECTGSASDKSPQTGTAQPTKPVAAPPPVWTAPSPATPGDSGASGSPGKSTGSAPPPAWGAPAGQSAAAPAPGAGTGCVRGLRREDITTRTWRFARSDGKIIAERVRLNEAGRMQGYYHVNEDNWLLENGLLVFRSPKNQVVTRFTNCADHGGRLSLSGTYLLEPRIQHLLTEVARDATPDGRDYTSNDIVVKPPTGPGPGTAPTGHVSIEACVDGSDWLRIDNGRLVHEHRAFSQIGTHAGCPASHAVAGGGFLINGEKVTLGQLPRVIGLPNLGRYEVAQARGATRLDGAKGLLLDDDGAGGPAIYIVRLYSGAGTPSPVTTGKPLVSHDNGNIGGVENDPRQPTTFTLREPRILSLIQNYHWNSARGQTPGNIGLSDAQGRRYGPWSAAGSPGQGGVPNAYWTAKPMVLLPAGTYTVIDSHPASWSHNSQSGYRGFTRVETLAPGNLAEGGRDYTSLPIQGDPAGSMGKAPAPAKVLFEIGNTGGVENNPGKGSKFELDSAQVITLIQTYHWNQGQGAAPGSIGLRCRDKQNFGPWPATGTPGQGGVPNAYWTVRPNVPIPATTCSVVDSDPPTWAHNQASGQRGFVRVEGYPAAASGTQAAPPSPVGATENKLDNALRALDALKGLFQ
jgi:hypothetical protein